MTIRTAKDGGGFNSNKFSQENLKIKAVQGCTVLIATSHLNLRKLSKN